MATMVTRKYPRTENFKGRTLKVRLMTRDDRDAVLKFARALPAEDLIHLRWDITRPERVDEWCANIEAGRTSSILAIEDDKVVGYGSLHHHQTDWSRHIGELRIMVNPDMRGLGLGRYMTQELLHVTKDLGLTRMVVHIASDQPRVRNMFEEMGFNAEALLTDWVIDRNDRMCDLIIMSYPIED